MTWTFNVAFGTIDDGTQPIWLCYVFRDAFYLPPRLCAGAHSFIQLLPSTQRVMCVQSCDSLSSVASLPAVFLSKATTRSLFGDSCLVHVQCVPACTYGVAACRVSQQSHHCRHDVSSVAVQLMLCFSAKPLAFELSLGASYFGCLAASSFHSKAMICAHNVHAGSGATIVRASLTSSSEAGQSRRRSASLEG